MRSAAVKASSPGSTATPGCRRPGHRSCIPGCSVKDSFASLNLADAGFRVLFDASWIHRAAPSTSADDHGWVALRRADELAEWAAAHGGGDALRPELLTDPDIAVLAARGANGWLAGAIGNRSGDVVGISNVFTTDDVDLTWEGAVAALAAHSPGTRWSATRLGTTWPPRSEPASMASARCASGAAPDRPPPRRPFSTQPTPVGRRLVADPQCQLRRSNRSSSTLTRLRSGRALTATSVPIPGGRPRPGAGDLCDLVEVAASRALAAVLREVPEADQRAAADAPRTVLLGLCDTG